jgi:hypothetical protein
MQSAASHCDQREACWKYLERPPRCVQAVVEGQQGAVLGPRLVTLLQQRFNVWVGAYLWQQSRYQLRGQHVGVHPQDGPSEAQCVRHQEQLPADTSTLLKRHQILRLRHH